MPAPSDKATPPLPMVLPLPVGRSLYTRLSALAQSEGLDLVTLVVQMVAYQAGASAVRPRPRPATEQPLRPDLAARYAVVCLACGRERTDAQQMTCPHCGGKWVKASA